LRLGIYAIFCSLAGKSQFKICQGRGPWILGCSMGLVMVILGMVNGDTNSAMEALEWQSLIILGHHISLLTATRPNRQRFW
jgi:hypothetical protein